MTTMTDVAGMAGVSTKAQATRDRSRAIGVVVNHFSSPYFGSLMEGIEHSLRAVGYNTIAQASHESADGQIAAWTSLAERECDGFIVHADMVPNKVLTDLMRKHPSTVLINRTLPAFSDRCLCLDNIDAGRKAANHLLTMGHRDIAIVTGPAAYVETKDRQTGFLRELSTAGISVSVDHIIMGDFGEASGEQAMGQLLDTGAKVTAVFAHNDLMAAGVIEACHQRGLRVPEDMSVLGFDDLDIARHINPKLSTMRQPLLEIGAAAGQMAYRLAASEHDLSAIPAVFAADVVTRASVKNLFHPA